MRMTNRDLAAAVAFFMVGSVAYVQAAPGELAEKPLFLGTDVQPNILWVVDDSGSMDWEVLKTNPALFLYRSCNDPDPNPLGGTPCFNDSGLRNRDNLDITPTSNDVDELLEHCVGYNVMAYDPRKKYTPWVGVDNADVAYADQSITSARWNPYNPGSGSVNLLLADGGGDPAGYYPWGDDGDGVFERGECGDSVAGTTITINYGNFVSAANIPVTAAAVDDPSTIMINEAYHSQTNFANWYSYYRKREYVAKRALSEIINDSQARMGLATLHNNNGVGSLVRDIDNISTPIDGDAQTNKENLMEDLFSIDSDGGTPLRQTLELAGKYFKVGTNPGSSLFGETLSSSESSPILDSDQGGDCQQNFSILMSDGFWNGGTPSVSNADANTSNPYDGGSHADTYSNTLADVAMYYYKNDLASGLDNNVPVITGVDENNAQHMVTYAVAFGVDGTLTNNPTDREASFSWPQPVENTPTTIDDMRHAAWNGRGEFLSAGDPDTLIASLQGAINDIADRDGAASAVAFNSTSLGTDTLVFQARFDSGGWHGTLSAFKFDDDGVGALQWDAASVLDERDLVSDPRQIITFNGTKGVSFDFPSNYRDLTEDDLSQEQVTDLLADAPFSVATTDADEIADNQEFGVDITRFLRGDDSDEVDNGGSFRNRFDKRLGDIVHSSPEFVAVPNRAYPNLIEGAANKYSDFVVAQKNRTPVVYVGANDGMVHAFQASNGRELFAYIPGILSDDANGKGLHYLADTNYSHIPYVDESPLAADVFVDGQWRTFLVGALRAGGKGVYVLDITSPSGFVESNAENIVKQEFTHNDLGYTFSRPLVGKMNNGRWAAIFGNGYNSDPTGDGKAKLFILYLDSTGGFEVVDTGVGSVVSSNCQNGSSDCNGLSSPTVLDLTSDGTIDRVYAGDIQGNVWAFDVSNVDSSNWKVAHEDAVSGDPIPLFSACTAATCTSANRQPITTVTVGKGHPTRVANSTEPNLMLYFGTGQYIASGDNTTTGTQTMYGLWDAGIGGLNRSDLQQQVISVSSSVTGGRDLTTNNVDYQTNSELGWYIDLPDSGERIVVDAVVVGSLVFFNTTVPDSASCNGGGYGYLMFVDRETGGQPDFTVLDLDNDGVFNDDIIGGIITNAIPGGSRLIDDKLVVSDSSGKISDFDVQTSKKRASSRASWVEIK